MKIILGLFLIISGIAVGLYVGVWMMFIGGIVQIIEAAKMEDIASMQIAIGAFKVLCAGFIGTICGFALIAPGVCVLQDN